MAFSKPNISENYAEKYQAASQESQAHVWRKATRTRACCVSPGRDGESELLTLYKGFHGELNMVVDLEGSIFRNTNISHVRLIKRSHFLCVLCHFW